MVWQVLAMWGIVILTITWFVRDERRLRREAVLVKAARHYATAPQYRHVTVQLPMSVPAPAPRVGGLSRSQREFLETLVKQS